MLDDGSVLGIEEGLVVTLGDKLCLILGDAEGLVVILGNALGLANGSVDGSNVSVVGFDVKLGTVLGTIDGNEL